MQAILDKIRRVGRISGVPQTTYAPLKTGNSGGVLRIRDAWFVGG